MNIYRLFGLLVRSELPLPELREASVPNADVCIRYGPVPPVGTPTQPVSLDVDGDVATLQVEGVARYRIAAGREILVDPDERASERNLRLYLLGSACGILLHQRAILPLHANAIDIGGRAIAFMGHSGAGKSTLAAALARRGHAVLSDDVCAVEWRGDDLPWALPGIGRLRLWRDTLEHSGDPVHGYEKAFDEVEKYTVPLGPGLANEAVPLACIYLLTVGEEPAVHRLNGAEAAAALIANTYRGGYVGLLAAAERHFAECVRLARVVPVCEFVRPRNLDRLDRDLDLLLSRPPLAGAASPVAAG